MSLTGQPGDLIVTGTLDRDGIYQVKTRWAAGILPAKSRKIAAAALRNWLTEHGCEFCAHQVKMRRDFTCHHLDQPRLALKNLDLMAQT